MSRDGFQFGLLGGRERLAVLPGVVGRRQYPVIPLDVPGDPLLTRPVHVEGRHLLSVPAHRVLLRSKGRRVKDPSDRAARGVARRVQPTNTPPSKVASNTRNCWYTGGVSFGWVIDDPRYVVTTDCAPAPAPTMMSARMSPSMSFTVTGTPPRLLTSPAKKFVRTVTVPPC